MKQIICIVLTLLLFNCNKSEEVALPTIDQKIYGRWLQSEANFESTTYTRSDRFGEFEKGIVVFDDGTIIERSEGGICVGEYCLMDNFYGTYTYNSSDKSLNIKVINFNGSQNYRLTIIDLSVEKLKVKKT